MGPAWPARNLGLLMLGGGVWISWGDFNVQQVAAHPLKTTALASLGVTVILLSLALLWGYLTLIRHANEPIEFWLDLQARYRPKIMFGCTLVGIASTIGFVLAFAAGLPSAAGAFVGPMIWCNLLNVGRLTGDVRPLTRADG